MMGNRADRKLLAVKGGGHGVGGALPPRHKAEQRKHKAPKVHQFFSI